MEHKTGIEDHYVIKNNKKLRMGYTTGSCAAGASKAAAYMLLTGQEIHSVSLVTPKGIELRLKLHDVCIQENQVSCAVRKDGGDDPDATNGILIYATVSKNDQKDIVIDGGKGVDAGSRADDHVIFNDGAGTDDDVIADLGRRRDKRCRMDLRCCHVRTTPWEERMR